MRTPRAIVALKIFIFIAGLAPLALTIADGMRDALGANPIEEITHRTGDWTLRFLLLTLAVTPLRKLLDYPQLLRVRRMLGLFAFFYACLHFTTYIWLDQFFDPQSVARDIIKRPFITVGFFAFVLLIPLAATSTDRAMRALGRRWQTLHRLVYVIGIAGVLHFLWLVKADILEPMIYAGILAFLLGYRGWNAYRAKQHVHADASSRPSR